MLCAQLRHETTRFIKIWDGCEKFTLNSTNIFDYGTVSIGIPKNEPPKELKFNLTAELTNIPHEQVYWDEAGYDVRLEATGKYLIMVMKLKNISDQSLTNVDYDSSGLGTTYVDGNMRGKLFTAADFAPVWKPSEVPLPPGAYPTAPNLVKTPSNLNITIPDYDVNSPYYVIQIDAEYNVIEIRGEQTSPSKTITRTCTLVRLDPQSLF